ncbi:MAG: MOSC domain-containing protein [Pseudomonadota bacterium]
MGARRPGPVDRARALDGLGLEGDVHAEAQSPRQLLLADASVYQDFSLPAHALGENLLVDIDTASLRSGAVLCIGAEVRLRLMFQCEACGQLDAVQQGLARRLGARRGVLARVLSGGIIRRGDAVRDLGVLLPAWSDDWRERVRRVLDAVPPDMVVEYRTLARLAGIQSSYCRAFPRLLASFGEQYVWRALTAKAGGTAQRWEGAGLFETF